MLFIDLTQIMWDKVFSPLKTDRQSHKILQEVKMKNYFFYPFIFLLLFGWFRWAYVQNLKETDSHLTIPWEEFKKLLNLDDNQIILPMETFQKIVAQTGVSGIPPHTVVGGNVILTREQFGKLVDQMKPPLTAEGVPPFDYLITRAVYSGKMGKLSTVFTGFFTVQVLKKDTYLRIPLLPQNMALEDITIGGKPALVVSENGFHQIILSKAGEYLIELTFSIKTELDKGPHRMDLYIQQTPITLLTLEMPLVDIDVDIPQAQQLQTSHIKNHTLISAVISTGQSISIQWRKKMAVAERIEPKIYSEIYHLLSIDDDVFRLNSHITYTILHSEIDAVRLLIPDHMNVLSISGEGVGEWQEVLDLDNRVIIIPFTYGKKGTTVLQVQTETPLSESGLGNVLTSFRTLGTVRETGFMGVELNTSAEVMLVESEGMEKIPPQKLPDQLVRQSVKPLMMGFKYVRHPYHLVMDVKKHEKIAVPVATITNASVVTLFTEDGKIVHRLIYHVRNSAKQFLEIQLTNGAEVWSVFVNNQPVEASLNNNNKLLIPLIRSLEVKKQLETFPVEVIIALSEKNFTEIGSKESVLPSVDLLISQLIWSVYLPTDFSYNYFNTTLEKEEIISGVNVFSGIQRRYNEKAMRELLSSLTITSNEIEADKLKQVYEGKDVESHFKNIPLAPQQLNSQLAAELEFSGRMEKIVEESTVIPPTTGGATTTGFLPIMIQIPTGGQVYRFAKTIIRPDDPLMFKVVYSRLWLNNLLKWILVLFFAILFYLNRRRFVRMWNWLKKLVETCRSWYQKYENQIKRISHSIMTPFILFGFVLVFWSFSTFLTMVCFFLWWVSMVYQVRIAIDRRKGRKAGQPESPIASRLTPAE